MSRSFRPASILVILLMLSLDASAMANPEAVLAAGGSPTAMQEGTISDAKEGPHYLDRAEAAPAPGSASGEGGPNRQAAKSGPRAIPEKGAQGSAPSLADIQDASLGTPEGPEGPKSECQAGQAPAGRAGFDLAPLSIIYASPDPVLLQYAAGAVGKPTQFNVTVANSGTMDAVPSGFRLTITDFFSNIIGDYSAALPSIAAGSAANVLWSWTPAYSTQFTVNATVTAPGDANQTNNTLLLKGLMVDRWLDDGSSPSGWSGDIAAGKWQIVPSMASDPRPSAHSTPGVWHCGQDDWYLNSTDASLVTPELDLRRMNPNYYVLFNFQYAGSTVQGDRLECYASDDHGSTWYPLFATLSGPVAGGWRYWVSHWDDYDDDGVVDPTEPSVYGLDISKFCGRVINIRLRFTSDAMYDDIGYYLDDFTLRGMENQNDVALLSIGAEGLERLGEEQRFLTRVCNLGQAQAAQFKAWFNLTDGTALSQNVGALQPGQALELLWAWTPALPGNFTATCTILPQNDEVPEDNSLWRPVHVAAAPARTLLVDDDSGPGNNGALRGYGGADVEWGVVNSLTQVEYDHYLVANDAAGPPLEVLNGYGLVIWLTGYDDAFTSRTGTLGASDRANLSAYEDGGGRLWLIGFEVMWDTWTVAGDTDFGRTRLRLRDFDPVNDDDTRMPRTLEGVAGDPISDGMDFPSIDPPSGLWDKCDRLQNASNAPGFLYAYDYVKDPLSGPFNALRFSGDFKLVFMAFEFTFISLPAHQAALTARVLDWLWGGVSLVPGAQGSVLPGSTVTIDIGLVNSERRNWTLDEVGALALTGGWTASCSPSVANGTPAISLPAMGTLVVRLNVTAPALAPAWTVGNTSLVVRLGGSPSSLTLVVRTTVLPLAGLSLSSPQPVMDVRPGEEALFTVSVDNQGNYPGSVNLSLRGEAAAWCRLSHSSLFIAGGRGVFVTVTADTPEGALAGAHNITIRGVMWDGAQDIMEELALVLVVDATHDLKIEMAPSGASVNLAEKLETAIGLAISNYGNVEETAQLALCATFSGWQQWRLPSVERTLQPSETAKEVQLSVGIPPTAPAGHYNLTVRLGYKDGELADSRSAAITVKVPDLAVSAGDIKLSPAKPAPRDSVQFTAVVHNGGTGAAPGAVVAFELGGKAIGTARIIEQIEPGMAATASLFYRGIAYGPNLLNVTVDPNMSVPDGSRTNNAVELTVYGYQPDLWPGAFALRAVGRAQPATNRSVTPGMVELSLAIRNGGQYCIDAENAEVDFLVDGAALETRVVSVGAGGEAVATALWLARPGSHRISAVIDPSAKLDERNSTDNEALLTVRVDQGVEVDGGSSLLDWLPLVAGIAVLTAVAGALVYQRRRGRPAGDEMAEGGLRPFRAKKGSSYKCAKCGGAIQEGETYLKCEDCDARYHQACAAAGICARCAAVEVGDEEA